MEDSQNSQKVIFAYAEIAFKITVVGSAPVEMKLHALRAITIQASTQTHL